MSESPKRRWARVLVYIVMVLVLVWAFRDLVTGLAVGEEGRVPYSEFRRDVDGGLVERVRLADDRIEYVRSAEAGAAAEESETWLTTFSVDDPGLVEELLGRGIVVEGSPSGETSPWGLLVWMLPLLPLLFLWMMVARRMGGAGGALSFGKSKARQISGELTGVTFDDVGGIDEVEVELKEVIAFLKAPERFTRMGARLPKGVLLVGPPGTGKTLVARATAGEAGVTFFSLSGSDFVEMFVGVGAARVRDLFEQAKAQAPCIVFIDEIDAIGRSRSTVVQLQTNDEREQTLNQLLNEMDGFDPSQGVVIMAATNRPEVLDRALLRAGRFDRQVEVPLPGEAGRKQILGIHTRKVPLSADVDLARLARFTAGLSGADLANIVNEAALMAVRREHPQVGNEDFDLALERVLAGLQRNEPLGPEVRRRVAAHEGGHALVAELLPNTDQVHKVSIIPTARGALGYTMQMPERDRHLASRGELEERLAVMLAGRAAELLVYGDTSTGAANDLERATELARRMVTEFGMSEPLGPVRYAPAAGSGYLGAPAGVRPDVSPETVRVIDEQVREIVEAAEQRATALLTRHRRALDAVANELASREVIGGEDVHRIATTFLPEEPSGTPEPGAGVGTSEPPAGSSVTRDPG